MSKNKQSRDYTLNRLSILLRNEKKYDITDMVIDFEYHESIESPFLRCDFTIIDAVDFNLNLLGGERIYIDLLTHNAKEVKLEVIMQIYKIGSISKLERQQMYILHTVSPEMYWNELNKVFKAFGPESTKDVPNIPYSIVERYLQPHTDKLTRSNFEDHSKLTFISPSWRPTDAIAYLSDKVTRTKGSKGSDKQSGFLFFETSKGFHFRSIDGLAEQEAKEFPYKYTQGGVDPNDKDGQGYLIESIQYPDRANHLQNLRMGTYKTVTMGISFPMPTDSNAQQPTGTSGNLVIEDAKKSDTDTEADTDAKGKADPGASSTSPSGVIQPPLTSTLYKTFGKASTLENELPFVLPDMLDRDVLEKPSTPATRFKMRALPGLKNIQGANAAQIKQDQNITRTDNVTTTTTTTQKTYPQLDNLNGNKPQGASAMKDQSQHSIQVATYAASRYNLMKAIQLNLIVPGNTALHAGDIIKVTIPSSAEEGKNVREDFKYSGKYLIAGLTHIWKSEGVTTRLSLVRDSTKRPQ